MPCAGYEVEEKYFLGSLVVSTTIKLHRAPKLNFKIHIHAVSSKFQSNHQVNVQSLHSKLVDIARVLVMWLSVIQKGSS